jgi:hypothetical protein
MGCNWRASDSSERERERERERESVGCIPALTNGNDLTLGDLESRRKMGGNVLVSLLISVVLWDVVQVVTANNDGAVHLGRHNGATEDAATDGDVAGEGALVVNVVAIDGATRSLEAKADVLVVAGGALDLLAKNSALGKEDGGLLLESLLGLEK